MQLPSVIDTIALMFAIIKVSGKQYKVSPKDIITVDRIPGEIGETLTIADVLLTDDNGKVNVGTPKLTGVKVAAKIVSQEKGTKIDVRRYKNKVRYRKKRGFRAQLTKLEIINVGRA